MNHCIRFYLVVCAAAALSGCETQRASEESRDEQSLAWLKTADPQSDANAAIARGELRFYAINGFAAGIIPGIDQHGADGAIAKTQGYRTIAGTSDYGNGDLNQIAYRYAEAYNRILLRHLGTERRNP